MSGRRSDSGTLERIFDVLSDPRRRALLHALREVETTTLETVADELVGAERNHPIGIEQTENAERLEMALHHTHLPKMAEAGVIIYDPQTRTIGTTSATDEAYDVLQASWEIVTVDRSE